MPNKAKRKGSDWERLAVELLNAMVKGGTFKRIPGSGALGTFLGEPILTSDIKGKVISFPQEFKIEAKVGYGGETQFTLKKEWLDKVRLEAQATYAIPLLAGKFSGAREGVKTFIVMDIETFTKIINRATELYLEAEENERANLERDKEVL